MTPNPPPVAELSLRALLLRHKRVSLGLLAVLAVFVAVTVPEALHAGSLTVTDSTSCSAWGAAKPKQQTAYARTYLTRHGSHARNLATVADVQTAVDNGCIQAFSYDEADTISVLQAINHQY